MVKELTFGNEMNQKILTGVKKAVDAISSTLGPCGRTVIIEQNQGTPTFTRDGVTVSKAIELEDKTENIGAGLIKNIAENTDSDSGDGTTTASVMGLSILTEGIKASTSGFNPIAVKNGINKAVDTIVKKLEEKAIPTTTKDQIIQVATISANNDHEIGSLIADAIESVGENGVITTTESKTTETSVELVEGMSFDKGFSSPYFAIKAENQTITMNNPYILLYDKNISTTNSILHLLEAVSQSQRPLLIISDVDGEALTTLVLNHIRGVINACVVKTPGFGDNKKNILEDIAILTGGKLIDEDLDMSLENTVLGDLGQAASVKITKDRTTIIDGYGNQEEVEARVKVLKELISQSTSEYEKEKLKERLAKIAGGVALIKVGAFDEATLKEKQYRIEDAINATRAAVESGVLPGGGVALCQIDRFISKPEMTSEEEVGYNIVMNSLTKPISLIAENSGVNGAIVSDKCKQSDEGIGYNALTGTWCNMVESGIIDPAKVTINALKNAASIASLIITSSCVITEKPVKEKEPQPMPQM